MNGPVLAACPAAKRLATAASRRTRQTWTGLANPLSVLFAKALVVKLPSEQMVGALANEDGVRFGQRLEPCRQIRCLSDD